MDPLTQELLQRQMGVGAQPPTPAVPPNPPTRIPQATKRFINAQQIQNAYRGGWTPNPVLLRASLGNR